MKKIILSLAVIALIAIGATSCKKSCNCQLLADIDLVIADKHPSESTTKKECLKYNQPGSYFSCKWE